MPQQSLLLHVLSNARRLLLRRGNHPSAKFWRRVLLPVIERYRDRDIPKDFRFAEVNQQVPQPRHGMPRRSYYIG